MERREFMLYHGVTLGGTGKDTGRKRHPMSKRALISYAQVISPNESERKPKSGRVQWLSDVPSDVTMVRFQLKLSVSPVRR